MTPRYNILKTKFRFFSKFGESRLPNSNISNRKRWISELGCRHIWKKIKRLKKQNYDFCSLSIRTDSAHLAHQPAARHEDRSYVATFCFQGLPGFPGASTTFPSSSPPLPLRGCPGILSCPGGRSQSQPRALGGADGFARMRTAQRPLI